MTEVVTGINTTYRTPGVYAEILFAQGPSNAAAEGRQVVFVMPMLASGTWTANTLYPIKRASDAQTGGGVGSPIHRGIEKFLKNYKSAKVWALPVAPTSGGSPVAANGTVTIANTATAAGTVSVVIAGELCQYTFASGDTPTEIAAGLVAVINGRLHLPVTAANVAGVVTITAKLVGISQGTATVPVITLRAEVTTGNAVTVATSGKWLGGGTGTPGVDGSTTEAANYATALATIDSQRKYYIVHSGTDATTFGNIKSHIVTKSEPKRGLRSVAIGGFNGTAVAAATIATGLNYERSQIGCGYLIENDVAEIAAAIAVERVSRESADATANMNGSKLDLNPPFDVADRLDPDDIEDALKDGVTPLRSDDSGVYMVQSVSTRSKDASGTYNDTRAARTLKVSGADLYTDNLLVRLATRFGQKKFKDDERLADGTVNPLQRQIPGVVRPSNIYGTIYQLIDDLGDQHLQNVDQIKASVSVEKSDEAPGMAIIRQELHVVDWLDQQVASVSEVSTG